jgi:hypothetical protein
MTVAGARIIAAAIEAVEALKRMKPKDERPQHFGWAPGGYLGLCWKCEEHFIGAKHATSCADCAYEGSSSSARV